MEQVALDLGRVRVGLRVRHQELDAAGRRGKGSGRFRRGVPQGMTQALMLNRDMLLRGWSRRAAMGPDSVKTGTSSKAAYMIDAVDLLIEGGR